MGDVIDLDISMIYLSDHIGSYGRTSRHSNGSIGDVIYIYIL